MLTPVRDEESGGLVYNFDITLKNDSAALDNPLPDPVMALWS